MNRWISVLIIFVATFVQASDNHSSRLENASLCSDSWYRFIEEKIPTSDDQGHGPDVGSDEWKSVIEFKLGIRNKQNLPSHNSEAWCRHIDQIVRERHALSSRDGNLGGMTMMSGPSFDCNKATGTIEKMICGDDGLEALDRKLAEIYADASKKAVNEHPPVLKAEQRGWIKGRNECWKHDDKRRCVRNEYQRRIAELQARYQLVPSNGPVHFFCDCNPANEVIVTFFRTDPPTLIAERGDQVSTMYLKPSGSGSKYQGRNEMFWEHQSKATISWGYGVKEMQCERKP